MEDNLEQTQVEVPQQETPKTGDLDKLYSVVNQAGLYTKSKDEFLKKYSTPENIDKLHSVVSQAGLYTKSKDDFYSKYYPDLNKVQLHDPIGVLAPKTKPSPYLKGLDFKSVTDAVKADKGQQEQNNSSLGALYNFAVGSLSKLGSGALARAAQSVPSSMGSVGGSPSGTNSPSTEERSKAALELGGAASDFIEKARSQSSSRENEASKEFDLSKGVGHNIKALGYQIPALAVDLGAGALTGGSSFFAQGEGSAIQELKNNPEASKLTPNQAAGYVMTQGTVNGVLMKLGFDKIFKSTGISDLVGKRLPNGGV